MDIPRPAVCLVTRARGAAGSPERAALLERLATAALAGVSMIQVRERQLDDRALASFVSELKSALVGTPAKVVVNDRIDIALAAGADGVHLKSDAPAVSEVRGMVPASWLVGKSVHSEEDARSVTAEGGCDYLIFGTVFPSASKPEDHPIAGIDALARVCRVTPLPVIAIGGITVPRAPQVAAAGAAGVAAISLFTGPRDVAATVAALRDALTLQRGNV